MKKLWMPLAAIAIAIGFWYVFKPKNPPVAVPAPVDGTAATGAVNAASAPVASNVLLTGVRAVPAGSVTQPATTPAAGSGISSIVSTAAVSVLPPLTVLDNARVVVHNYCATFGENPVGNNSEIAAALKGKNSKQINFIADESGLRVNEQGELIDAWGTPFFFHQLSGKVMEIRSAGEDRKMWTFDDQVTR